MTVSRNKLDRKDIDKMGLLSILEQSCFSFERMQAPGFVYGMIPGFKKIYGDNTEEIAKAMSNNMDFINTEPHMATFLQGLVLSLEEAGQERELIKNIKTGLFGPLAGLGDAIFWFTLLPISAAICCSLSSQGSVFGPILYIIIWGISCFSRIWFARFGYKLGVGAIEIISANAAAISKAAGILGVMVVGGLIPSYISFAFSESFVAAGGVSVQGVFDGILPNILPLGFVFLLYWAFRKKGVNTLLLIVLVIVFSIIASYLGIM
ncbi:MAG: PTS system mannose/fructose/sorbose family transporter subunit IID [Erysipelotrichaceae bacterium]|jgi:PTS system galactosamine-specific IID component|nr:PTS system mannose/fructose/sorbose family transporter subunit IID [Erysipelotrichaceae bacterium]